MDEKEYRRLLGEKRASRLNVVIRAVNEGVSKSLLGLDEVEERFYDNLVVEAREHAKKYGKHPVFEMMEIEWDDPILDIYAESVEEMAADIRRMQEERRKAEGLTGPPRI